MCLNDRYLLEGLETRMRCKFHIFNSFFYTKLSKMNWENEDQAMETISRSIEGLDILANDYVFMPVVEQ